MSDNDGATQRLIEQLRALIAEARPVPMSASCMVNRGEALSLLDQALESLPQELSEAKAVIAASQAEVMRGQDRGREIRMEAEEWAAKMASQTEIARLAQEQADESRASAKAECDALRQETDAYVDTRMAEFEAALARTASQVKTMRARLADRKGPVAEDETIILPRL